MFEDEIPTGCRYASYPLSAVLGVPSPRTTADTLPFPRDGYHPPFLSDEEIDGLPF